MIYLWSKILSSIPKSKLILKNKILKNEKIYKRTLESFKNNGIDNDCLILLGESKSRKSLLKVYNEIDISLDPFPFQGNTSTIESVWMGVPVLTLKGNRFVFHFGESINANLNMNEWIANNHDEYVEKAIKHSNKKLLRLLKNDLKLRAQKSVLFNTELFCSNFCRRRYK